MEQQKIISEQLLTTCTKYKSEYTEINTKCDDEGGELEKILYDIHLKEQEGLELGAQTESCEYQISQQMETIEELNSMVEEKNEMEQEKEAAYKDSELTILGIKEQVVQFESELKHLKQIEEKLVMENSDIQQRLKAETSKNSEINANMY